MTHSPLIGLNPVLGRRGGILSTQCAKDNFTQGEIQPTQGQTELNTGKLNFENL